MQEIVKMSCIAHFLSKIMYDLYAEKALIKVRRSLC